MSDLINVVSTVDTPYELILDSFLRGDKFSIKHLNKITNELLLLNTSPDELLDKQDIEFNADYSDSYNQICRYTKGILGASEITIISHTVLIKNNGVMLNNQSKAWLIRLLNFRFKGTKFFSYNGQMIYIPKDMNTLVYTDLIEILNDNIVDHYAIKKYSHINNLVERLLPIS